MKWIDAEDIGIALSEKFPEVDPLTIRFTDLRQRVLALDGFDDDPKKVNFVDLYNWVMALEGFDDDPKRAGEKVLEAIQAAWIEEAG